MFSACSSTNVFQTVVYGIQVKCVSVIFFIMVKCGYKGKAMCTYFATCCLASWPYVKLSFFRTIILFLLNMDLQEANKYGSYYMKDTIPGQAKKFEETEAPVQSIFLYLVIFRCILVIRLLQIATLENYLVGRNTIICYNSRIALRMCGE